jgi:hypothetical protein
MFNIKNLLKLGNKNIFFRNFKSFSTIRLMTKHGEINRSANPDFNINLNWELAKVWVTPNNKSYINNLKPVIDNTNEHCIVTTIGKVTQLDFDRLARRMGLAISKHDSVYVQDGLCKGKKVRIISSSKEDASTASSILEEVSQHSTPDIHVLYLTGNEEIGMSKKFVLYDKKQKIVLSNAKNTESLKQAIENI